MAEILKEDDMKKYFLLFLIFTCFACLNAKWLYVDAGVGFDFTELKFKQLLYKDVIGVENFSGSIYNYRTLPNFNFRIGVNLPKRIVLITDIQTIRIDKNYYNQAEIERWNGEKYIAEHRLYIESLGFFGFGIIFYPLEKIQVNSSFYLGWYNYKDEHILNYGSSSGGGLGLGGGYAISLAYEISKNKLGFLIGCKYLYADMDNFIGSLGSPFHIKYDVSSFGIFIKIKN